MRRALLLALLALAPAFAGCGEGADDADGPLIVDPAEPTPPPDEGNLTFGGRVVDARTGEPLANATLRLELGQTLPCKRQGVLWNAYELPVDGNGSFGPRTFPLPKSDDVAFFLHADAPGYARNDTFIGPAEARRGTRNLTVVLHPDANLTGTAPPGTVVALSHPGYPRFAVANETGTFVFEGARVFPSAWVVATEPPALGRTAAPADLGAFESNGTVWRLEGTIKGPDGEGLAADVVAWNGSSLASAARTGPAGHFALPLLPERQDLLVEARTPDGRYGGVLRVLVEGPPSLRQNVVLRALC